MILLIEDSETEESTVIFGVGDFNCGENLTEVWLHRSIEVGEYNDSMVDVNGRPMFANEEFDQVAVDVSEEVAHYCYDDNTDVIIGLTNKYPSTIKGVVACIKEDDVDTDQIEFIGDYRLIEERLE